MEGNKAKKKRKKKTAEGDGKKQHDGERRP